MLLSSRVRDKLMIVVCFLIEMLFVYLLFQQPSFIRIMFLVSVKTRQINAGNWHASYFLFINRLFWHNFFWCSFLPNQLFTLTKHFKTGLVNVWANAQWIEEICVRNERHKLEWCRLTVRNHKKGSVYLILFIEKASNDASCRRPLSATAFLGALSRH